MWPDRAHARQLLRQQVHRAVHANRQHVVVALQRAVHRAHPHIGPEPADAGLDFLMRLRMHPNHARQPQQPQRLLQHDLVAVHAPGQ